MEFPQCGRTVESLRRKIATLHPNNMPTGEPLMPQEVRNAKQIRYTMSERADLGFDYGETADAFFPVDYTTDSPEEIAFETSSTACSMDGGKEEENSASDIIVPRTGEIDSSQSRSLSTSWHSEERFTIPLVHRRGSVPKLDEDDDLMPLLKAQIVQDGIHREEEHRRREEERKEREEELREDRTRRDSEARRHDSMMQTVEIVGVNGVFI